MPNDDDFDSSIDDEAPEERDENDEGGDEEKGKDDDRAVRAAKAARKERNEARQELAKLRRELAELKTAKGDTKDTGKDDAERDRDADERAFTRYRPVLIRAAAESALVRAGAKPDRVNRLTRLLEVDDISVDEKGGVDADDLQAEVERLKEEMPELFRSDDEDDKPVRRPGARRVDGGTKGKQTPTSTAKLAAALTGRR